MQFVTTRLKSVVVFMLIKGNSHSPILQWLLYFDPATPLLDRDLG